MARVRSGNQRATAIVTERGNNAKQMAAPDSDGVMTRDFPIVETGDHITGELYDPMALEETTDAEPILQETVDNQEPMQTEPTMQVQPDSEISDPRFQGKDVTDVLKSYKELEKKFHERDEEIGNYRKMFDRQVQESFQKQQPAQAPVDDGEENKKLLEQMLADPKGFVTKVKQQVFGELNSLAVQQELKAAQAKSKEIVTSPDFANWLRNNVPYHIAQLADNDPQTYNWIVNQYQSAKAPQKAVETAKQEATVTRRVAENAAGLPTASAPRGKPVYTRSSIMKLMRENPSEYERLQPDIMQAYREGRVK